MKNQKFKGQAINASSMADIAFLLLIFFLVTTTITNDEGILVKLPPHIENQEPDKIPDRNVFSVKINGQNELLVEGQRIEVAQLREATKAFIMNPDGLLTRPSKPTKAVVSLLNDRETLYGTYLSVYNELKGAYNELWNEMAYQRFQSNYESLTFSQKKEIRSKIPLVVSEAEPTNFGN